MQNLKKVLDSIKEKNNSFRKKIESKKKIKIKFSSLWFYSWGPPSGGG